MIFHATNTFNELVVKGVKNTPTANLKSENIRPKRKK